MIDFFVVYFNPRDYPGLYVVRRHQGLTPTSEVWSFSKLKDARRNCASRGLVCLARHHDDDPTVVETWV